ncbi:ABC transporter substrate-binding protein [Shewanella gaetbuli]|uniref:ABC transporter substrate-binding protein n=1 Tax=Shewanella gaetbuli TaxID=220752 RepID=A0A9X1ZL65_9GAMM|nr:ABC transporter substrate-binding protein [Shewanella gaetbuli]MCL1143753.1 ABC transporter substrate-binding protein [Shewanella gaetbuli]
MKLPAILLVISVTIIIACQPNIDTPVEASSQPLIKIAVSKTPLSAPFFVAEQQGFFNRNGLNIDLVLEEGGVKCFEELIEGNVDFATTSETVIMFNSFYHDNLSVLASFVESDNDVKLLTLSPEKFQHISQIEGAKVGIVKGSASEFFFDSLLMLYHQTNIQIEKVYLAPNQLVPAIINAEVDIISVWEPFAYYLQQQQLNTAPIMNTKGLYNLSFNLLGLKQSEFNASQKQRILHALRDAENFIITHPEQAQAITSKALNMKRKQLSYLWQDYSFRLSLGNAFVSSIQLQTQWAIDKNLVPKDNRIDIRTIIDKQLFESAMAQYQGRD